MIQRGPTIHRSGRRRPRDWVRAPPWRAPVFSAAPPDRPSEAVGPSRRVSIVPYPNVWLRLDRAGHEQTGAPAPEGGELPPFFACQKTTPQGHADYPAGRVDMARSGFILVPWRRGMWGAAARDRDRIWTIADSGGTEIVEVLPSRGFPKAARMGKLERKDAGPQAPSAVSCRTWTVAEMARWRALGYRVFATLLLPPEDGRIRWLAAMAAELRQFEDDLAMFAFFGPWQRFVGALLGLQGRGITKVQVEYVRLFQVNPAGAPCFPYESYYVSASPEAVGWIAAQLQQTYAGAGLDLAPDLHESPDHGAVELEYMSYLCQQEAAAWERAATDDGLRLLGQERAFLRGHLGRWFSVFADQVRITTREALYSTGIHAADAFVQHDLDLVDTMYRDIDRLRRQMGPPWGVGKTGTKERDT